MIHFPVKSVNIHYSYKFINNNNDLYMLLPYGKKGFMWFPYSEPKQTYFIEHKNDVIMTKSMKPIQTYMSKDMFQNTIVYGTLIDDNRFIMEDIYFYKNRDIHNSEFNDKLKYLYDVLKNSGDNSYETVYDMFPHLRNSVKLHFVSFTNDYSFLFHSVMDRIYDVHSVLTINKQNGKTGKLVLHNMYQYFKIEECQEGHPFSYDLLCYDKNNTVVQYTKSVLPSINISDKYNSFVRNNYRIDDIEMSDDENDDSMDSQTVKKSKNVVAKCIYDKHLKRWIPLKFYGQNKRLSTISNVKYTERLMNNSRII